MTVKINYKSNNSKKGPSNLVLFVDEKFNISGLKKEISNSEFSYISDLLKTSDLKKDLLFFELISKVSIFFFKSLDLNKSEIYKNSFDEICFFNPLILNFSSTNKIRFDIIFFGVFFE